jgi:hypothetical protein
MTDAHRVDADAPSRRGWRHWWPIAAAVIAAGLYAGLAGLEWWIVGNAHAIGGHAAREFGGDEVSALCALVQSDSHTLRRRDEAVYALGQLADPRALATLERYETGRPCDHEHGLCQYELRKAIDRCSGRNQPPRWLPLFPHRPGAAPGPGDAAATTAAP